MNRLYSISIQRDRRTVDRTIPFELPEGAQIVDVQWFEKSVYVTVLADANTPLEYRIKR